LSPSNFAEGREVPPAWGQRPVGEDPEIHPGVRLLPDFLAGLGQPRVERMGDAPPSRMRRVMLIL
jgi:hypothetical protein